MINDANLIEITGFHLSGNNQEQIILFLGRNYMLSIVSHFTLVLIWLRSLLATKMRLISIRS